MSWANPHIAPPRTIRDDLAPILTEYVMHGGDSPGSEERTLKLFVG